MTDNDIEDEFDFTGMDEEDTSDAFKKGRPKKKQESDHDQPSTPADGTSDFISSFEIPPESGMATPGEVADYRSQLEKEQAPELKNKVTKLNFENKSLRQWLNNVFKQLKQLQKQGNNNINIPPPPESMMNNDPNNPDISKLVKTVAPYMLIKDMFKEEAAPTPAQNNNEPMITIAGADGNQTQMPVSYYPMYMASKQPQSQQQQPPEMVNIKLGDETHTIPASAMGSVLNLTHLLQPQQSQPNNDNETTITIEEPDGKKVTFPVSYYPMYMVSKQQQQPQQPQQQPPPDKTLSTIMGAISEMRDTTKRLQDATDPQRLGENALKGLMNKAEEWNELKAFFGNNGNETENIQTTRIQEQEKTKRDRFAEANKTKREQEKTRQAETEATKFKTLMDTAMPIESIPEIPQQKPLENVEDAGKKTARETKEFIKTLKTKKTEANEQNKHE